MPEPTVVRYAWASNPKAANLYNKEGLPASLFTTEVDLPPDPDSEGEASPAGFAVHMANGIKVGEVTSDSAILWTRLTQQPEANWQGKPLRVTGRLASVLPG